LDEQDEGHYHDRDENCEEDPLAKDLLVGAEVHLPRREGTDGSENEKESRPVGKVVGRKQNSDGSLVGSYHPDNRLDARQYEVEFTDGAREAYVYNTIATINDLPLQPWRDSGWCDPVTDDATNTGLLIIVSRCVSVELKSPIVLIRRVGSWRSGM
jgi:hypothetical protein